MTIIEAIIDFMTMIAKLIGAAGSMAVTGTRRRQMREYAVARGCNWRRDKRSLTKQLTFDLFRGKAGTAANVIELGSGEILFDFNYASGGGRPGSANYAPHIHTCLILPVSLIGPGVRIAPRVIESVQRVPFESEAFNKRFTVTSTDQLFASALVDQRMMAWLLDQPGTWRIEMRNGRILVSAPLVTVERLDEMQAFARGFRERIPAVVRSLRGTTEIA